MKKEMISVTKRFILFGAGLAGQRILKNLAFPIEYFVDNDPQRWDRQLLGKRIYRPNVLLDEDRESIVIIISSMYGRQIAAQLKEMGFEEGRHFLYGAGSDIDPEKANTPFHYPIQPRSRYGYGKPAHPKLLEILARNGERYREHLMNLLSYGEYFKEIPISSPGNNDLGPFWNNGWMPGIDALTICGFLAAKKPRIYLEVGSGNSTKFARWAVEKFRLPTKIISIDPMPRAEIDALCDQIYRERLEEADLKIFDRLGAGDLLFVDNSHQTWMNSDVTVTFLDVIPYLKSGVLVGLHDIFLPDDYPPQWVNNYYSEQYVLAAYLLAEGNHIQIELPNHYVLKTPELNHIIQTIWTRIGYCQPGGGAFWFQIR
jgi:hypothetical protein